MVIQRLCLLLCIYLLLLSCNNTERQLSLQKNIIGDWITVTETPQSKNVKHIIDIEGLIFYNDSLPNKSFYYVGHNNTLGYTSQYKIRNDSLFLFDRADKYWKGYKLVKLTADTLKLEQFGVSTSLIRIKKIKKPRGFDKVILSTSGCYGTCPIFNISINPNGEVLFNGEEYTLKRGLQKGTLSKEIYKRLEYFFTRLDIDALESNYEANWTDDETITVTFFKNGKIYKTISDYGRMAPYPFIWACMRLEEAYKNIKLEPIATPDYLTSFGPINKIQYLTSDRHFFIRKSEWFLLFEQLLSAKQTKQSFKPKFAVKAYDYWDPGQKVNEIASDGRYYKFMVKGKAMTLDIGYDFLEQNRAALSLIDERNSIKH